MSSPAAEEEEKEVIPPPSFSEVLHKASKSAIRGGTAGAVAMGANVGALMWMRTTVCIYVCMYYVCKLVFE